MILKFCEQIMINHYLAPILCWDLVCWIPPVLLVGISDVFYNLDRTRGPVHDSTGHWIIFDCKLDDIPLNWQLTETWTFKPIGVWGFFVNISTGWAIERFEMKSLLVAGFFLSVIGTLPATFVKPGDTFWP